MGNLVPEYQTMQGFIAARNHEGGSEDNWRISVFAVGAVAPSGEHRQSFCHRSDRCKIFSFELWPTFQLTVRYQT